MRIGRSEAGAFFTSRWLWVATIFCMIQAGPYLWAFITSAQPQFGTLYACNLLPSIIVMAFALLDASFRVISYRRERRRTEGYCAECGYCLAGNESGICPECGEPTGGRPGSAPS